MKNLTIDELRTRVIDALEIDWPKGLEAIQAMSRERLEGMLEILEVQPKVKAQTAETPDDEFVVLRAHVGARMEAGMGAHGIAKALWESGYRVVVERPEGE